MKILDQEILQRIKSDYENASVRVLFLDYDGTLVPFASRPDIAIPGKEVLQLLEGLASIKQNNVVIISGRDRYFLDKVFSNMNLTLVAEHGFFIRKPGEEWKSESLPQNNWKPGVREVMFRYKKKFPGSMIEEKESTLAWHYRNCAVVPTLPEIDFLKILLSLVFNGYPVELLEGSKVLEVKKQFSTKGSAAIKLLKEQIPGFIIAIGDDLTDEDLFRVLPEEAFTIKVGNEPSLAKYFCLQQENVNQLLTSLLNPKDAPKN